MKDQFIPCELALELKELGFDELCFGYYTHNEKLCRYDSTSTNVEFTPCIHKNIYNSYCLAPLWQQAFDWLWNKTGRYIIPIPNDDKEWLCMGNKFKTYEEARLECLKKLIEIVKND